MKLSSARIGAESMLELIIKSQPDLLHRQTTQSLKEGAVLADFCHDFIEQYAKRLMERSNQD